jgi:hypothetical protein
MSIIKKFNNGLQLEAFNKKNGMVCISLNKETKYSDIQKDWINMCGLVLDKKFERFVYLKSKNGYTITQSYPKFADSIISKLTTFGEIIDSLDGKHYTEEEYLNEICGCK